MLETPSQSINFQFITVAWGKPYIDLLVDVAIPSQMAPGNLPNFPYLATSTYILYTTSEGRAALDNSLAFRRLAQLMSTEVRLIDDVDFHRNKYGIAAECQQRAMSFTENTETAFVWLYPDVVFPDGALTNMGRIASTGKRAVLHVGLSAVTQTCVPELLQDHRRKDSDTIAIPPRDLVNLAIKHLDPAIGTFYLNSDRFNSTPSQLFWEVPGEGLLTRWFHLSPLMVCPRRIVHRFSDSIDNGDYLRQAGLRPDDIYVAQDSDEIFQFSLSSTLESYPGNTYSTVKVLRWAAMTTGTIDARFLRHRFRIHYTEPTSKWQDVERESDIVVESIARGLRIRFVFLLPDWKLLVGRVSWSLRHSRLGRIAKAVLKRQSSLHRTSPSSQIRH